MDDRPDRDDADSALAIYQGDMAPLLLVRRDAVSAEVLRRARRRAEAERLPSLRPAPSRVVEAAPSGPADGLAEWALALMTLKDRWASMAVPATRPDGPPLITQAPDRAA